MKAKKQVLRKCIVCGQMIEKKDLIRIVKNKENEVFIDDTGKANGRGAYVCKSDTCKEKIKAKKNIISNVFKMNVNISDLDL